ncbi:MAG TPA: hypothetical protein VIW68_12645 [Candidatus Sulfotelmatobacter sp.]
MQVKASPLNPDPKNEGQFVPSENIGFPALAGGTLRVRLNFLPMNDAQHDLVAELLQNLKQSDLRIVAGQVDSPLRFTRDDEVAALKPGQEPKIHSVATPLWIDIEIGPAPAKVSATPPAEPAAKPASPDTPPSAPAKEPEPASPDAPKPEDKPAA